MTGRDSFTPEEWRTLAQTPVEVMYGVVVSSYGGMRRELRAIRRTLRRTDEFAPETELVTNLAGFLRVNAARFRRDAEGRDFERHVATARARDYCRDAATILRTHATKSERDEYAEFVLWCAEEIVEAGVEGGILRVGGRRVSPAERGFVDSVADEFARDGRTEESGPEE